jgi:uncharacterized protein (TIGR00725 family)
VAVIGAGEAGPDLLRLAREVGRLLAQSGAVLVCGGLGGVMAAAAEGAAAAGGVVIGILPGPNRTGANPHLTYAIPTNLGHARNVVIAHTADALIAVGGGYGTISEAAIALKLGKPVVGLAAEWSLPGLLIAGDPPEAVMLATRSTRSPGL